MWSRTSSIVISVLGIALVVLAIFTVAQTSDLSSKVSDLQDANAGLEDKTASLEAATATGGKDVAGEIDELSLGLKKLRACLPEIQNEINGLSVEVEGGYAYIENNSQVSSYCQPVVYPQTGGAGE